MTASQMAAFVIMSETLQGLIDQETNEDRILLDVSKINPGCYVLKIYSANAIQTRKLVIKLIGDQIIEVIDSIGECVFEDASEGFEFWRRIVACVNACRGIISDMLEEIATKGNTLDSRALIWGNNPEAYK